MDHFKIIKRAAETTWYYKALWIFGIIIALGTMSGSGGGGGGGGNASAQFRGGHIPPVLGSAIITLVLFFLLIMIVFGLFVFVARYLSRSALIQMVNQQEETGERHTIRQGFRLGWSRYAWKIFLIDLLTALPLLAILVPFFMAALSPLLLLLARDNVIRIFGVFATVASLFVYIIFAVILSGLIKLLRRFFYRACVLEDLGVWQSLGKGFRMLQQHFFDVGLMALFTLGVNLVFFFVISPLLSFMLVIIVGILAIPLLIGLGIPLVGLVLLLNVLLGIGSIRLVIGLVILLLFLLIGIFSLIGLATVGGIMETFLSSTWTLTYRELLQLEAQTPEESPTTEAEAPTTA